MSDLENRLSEGLAGTAERAPHPADLASGARVRLRRRRRTATAVVAASVAVVAVPVGVTLVGSSDRPDRETTVSEAPGTWRTETWRDLSLRVPPEWAWGGGRGWCADGRELGDSRQVSRPAELVPVIVCTPSYGYGAHFQRPSVGELPPGTEGAVQQYRGDRYPDGSWIGYVSTQQSAVWVVAEDRATARKVLDSVEPVGEVDANGCATRVEVAAPSGREQFSVCRYDRDGWLEQSELLSGEDSLAAGSAVQSAPPARKVSPTCSASYPPRPVVTMSASGVAARLFFGRGCGIASVFSDGSGTGAMVTEDVLYWALSPGWSGAVGSDVPLPERLRGR